MRASSVDFGLDPDPARPEGWYEMLYEHCRTGLGADRLETLADESPTAWKFWGERNVEALALIDLSHVATTRGESATTMELIKRATSMALGGEIDIFATGMVFCNAIWACRCRGEWQRAQEWTESATRWVTRQRVEYFPGMCRVHRSDTPRSRYRTPCPSQKCRFRHPKPSTWLV